MVQRRAPVLRSTFVRRAPSVSTTRKSSANAMSHPIRAVRSSLMLMSAFHCSAPVERSYAFRPLCVSRRTSGSQQHMRLPRLLSSCSQYSIGDESASSFCRHRMSPFSSRTARTFACVRATMARPVGVSMYCGGEEVRGIPMSERCQSTMPARFSCNAAHRGTKSASSAINSAGKGPRMAQRKLQSIVWMESEGRSVEVSRRR